MKMRVLIADDHQIVRQGLRSVLENQPDIEVIAEASDGRETVRLAEEMSPDVVVMDVAMSQLSGIEATRQIVDRVPGTKVISLSMHAESRFVNRMLEAGACAYVLKDCAFEELNQAINVVVANQTYLSPKIAGLLVKDYVHQLHEDSLSPFSVLTPRERIVLQLVVEGKTAGEIASHLTVSVKTIESQRQEIMDKLDTHSIADLTKYVVREGLASL